MQLDYILCSDEYLAEMNVEHLAHDTLTDIITFDLSDDDPTGASFSVETSIEGECYISQERVTDNAGGFGESLTHEMLRVLSHGLLHLCGFGDKSAEESAEIRAAEDSAIAEWVTFRRWCD